MNQNAQNRRKRLFANSLHKDLFLFATSAVLIPASIVVICLYYLIFSIVAREFGIPEGVAYYVIPAAKKVTTILLCTAPLTIGVILFITYKLTHRLVGPADRIIRELDQVIAGNKKNRLNIRKGDRLEPLVERINTLVDKYHT